MMASRWLSPLGGESRQVPGIVSGFAQIVRYRAETLGAFDTEGATPMVDAMISKKEPQGRDQRDAELDRGHPEPGNG